MVAADLDLVGAEGEEIGGSPGAREHALSYGRARAWRRSRSTASKSAKAIRGAGR